MELSRDGHRIGRNCQGFGQRALPAISQPAGLAGIIGPDYYRAPCAQVELAQPRHRQGG